MNFKFIANMNNDKIKTDNSEYPEWLKNLTKKEHLGKGTYGSVHRFEDSFGQSIAIKKTNLVDDGIPSTALREIGIVSQLNHPNVIKLQKFHISSKSLYLAFEFCELDLKKYMRKYALDTKKHNIESIKTIMFQICKGLHYLHSNMVIHRDLKPCNILIDPDNLKVKITDFGLARSFFFPIRPFTTEIASLYYRAPEILLGSKDYSTGVDVWAAGCILAELFLDDHIFAGECEFTQLMSIFR